MHSNNTQLNQRKIEVLVNIYEKIELNASFVQKRDENRLWIQIYRDVIKLLPRRFDDKNLSLLIDDDYYYFDAAVQNSFVTSM